jgi:hypothetical protein
MASRAVNLGVLIIVCALGWYGYRLLTAGKVQWHAYEEGTALMKSADKKGFLLFTAQWCGFCRRMEEETLRDPRVAAYLNERFIPMKVRFTKNDPLVARYGVEGIPSTWILAPDGRRLVQFQGYLHADRLLKALKRVEELAPEETPFPRG